MKKWAIVNGATVVMIVLTILFLMGLWNNFGQPTEYDKKMDAYLTELEKSANDIPRLSNPCYPEDWEISTKPAEEIDNANLNTEICDVVETYDNIMLVEFPDGTTEEFQFDELSQTEKYARYIKLVNGMYAGVVD